MPDTTKGKGVLLDGVFYERHADGSLVPTEGQTDWARLDALSEAEIETAAQADSDSRPMSDDEWRSAKVVKPGKESITIRLDKDVLGYFQRKPGRYQSNINAALRRAMENEKKAG